MSVNTMLGLLIVSQRPFAGVRPFQILEMCFPALGSKRTKNTTAKSVCESLSWGMGTVTGANLISGLIRKRGEVAGQLKVAQKAADAVKDDLAAIDRALEICGYKGDPRGIAPRGKYKQMFGRSELKRTILDQLHAGPKDDETIAAQIILDKGWTATDDLHADVLKRVRHAIQRLRNTDYVVQDFGPDGVLWKRVT